MHQISSQNSFKGVPSSVSEREAQFPRADRVDLSCVTGHHFSLPSCENQTHPEEDPFCRLCGQDMDFVPYLLTVCLSLAEERRVVGVHTKINLWDW